MSKYQQEWKIRSSGGDLLIRVPEDTDMDLLRLQFSDLISAIAPILKTPASKLKFYVGNSDESDFIFTLN